MAEREELLQAVRARLEQVVATQDFAPVLGKAALTEAEHLAGALGEDETDLHARYLLGWLHWYRHQGLPDGQDRQDLDAAISLFTPCFIVRGVGDLPEPLLPLLADRAVPDAAALLQEALDSAGQTPLSTIVQLWQHILQATPVDDPDRTGYQSNLGNAFQIRFERTEVLADLDTAIEHHRAAVEDTPVGHPDRAGFLSNLGNALRLRFERTAALSDLDTAIEAGRQAFEAAPADDPDRGMYQSNLGIALLSRFERTGVLADLEAAIGHLREAAEAAPADDPDRGMYQSNLGIALEARYGRTGVLADLEAAIGHLREAADVTPAGAPDRAGYQSNLGKALQARFGRTGELADLDMAIGHLRKAVGSTSAGRTSRAGFLSNLGNALQARFERTGVLTDLDNAIEAGHQAVDAVPGDHPNRATYLSNLGNSQQIRFGRTGELADLDIAIGHLREAVKTTPADHPNRAKYQSNLGGTLQTRFGRTGVLTDLDNAIEAGHQAVDAVPADHPDRASYQSNLGIALQARFGRTGELADLDMAIGHLREAVKATPADDPDRPAYLSNLGAVLRARFEQTGAIVDLDNAAEAGYQAVEATPADHPDRASYQSNLGGTLQIRFEWSGAQTDREAALSAFRQGAGVSSAAPSTRIRAAWAAASLAAGLHPGDAANLAEDAVRLLPEVAPRYLERSEQQYAIGRFAGLASDAAALALADTGTPADQRAARALRLLEAARAVLLSQALNTRSDLTDLRGKYPDLAARFVELRDLLDQTSDVASSAALLPEVSSSALGTPAHRASDRRHLAQEFTRLLDRIRALDGFATFAQPPATEDLLTEAGHGPVVMFNISRYGSDALLMTTSGVTALPLPGLDPATVIDHVNAFYEALHTTGDLNPGADRIGAQAAIRDILAWLWDTAADPVLRALGHHHTPAPRKDWPRVWWAPGGLMGLLPIHAAGYHTADADPAHRSVMERVISSYTPTIGALAHARRHLTARHAEADRSLIVAMPTTPGLPGQGRLPNVPAETAMLQTRLPHPHLLAEPGTTADLSAQQTPTKATVLAHLNSRAIAHFACHGYSDPSDPSRSQLLLHDHASDPLTVAALAPVALDRARLAYLSACSTALTADTTLLDEAIHLTSAFQLAGFPHVIGTLWQANDELAIDIAENFYTALASDNGVLDTSRATHALHQAVRKARDRYPITPSLWAAHIHAGA